MAISGWSHPCPTTAGDDAPHQRSTTCAQPHAFTLPPCAQVYRRVPDLGAFATLVEEALSDYNATSVKPMRLVLFADALDHVARICRCLLAAGAGPGVC